MFRAGPRKKRGKGEGVEATDWGFEYCAFAHAFKMSVAEFVELTLPQFSALRKYAYAVWVKDGLAIEKDDTAAFERAVHLTKKRTGKKTISLTEATTELLDKQGKLRQRR